MPSLWMYLATRWLMSFDECEFGRRRRAEKLRTSVTVALRSMMSSCGTNPTSRLYLESSDTSPLRRTLPPVRLAFPVIRLKRVVFPAPDGPITAHSRPFLNSPVTPCMMVKPSGRVYCRSSNRMVKCSSLSRRVSSLTVAGVSFSSILDFMLSTGGLSSDLDSSSLWVSDVLSFFFSSAPMLLSSSTIMRMAGGTTLSAFLGSLLDLNSLFDAADHWADFISCISSYWAFFFASFSARDTSSIIER
mmetsp:Transcript_39858/g.77490  ORF Transcript_39858/g.77490 Transcript_39858/m.77490 type:complete len:246 (+) Transcript_39858:1435-2172(+)